MSKPFFYPDGFCRGSEMPDDLELDRLIYPERPAPRVASAVSMTMPHEDWLIEMDRQEKEQEAANFRRDRQFHMTVDNVTGTHTGPPRTVGSDTKED